MHVIPALDYEDDDDDDAAADQEGNSIESGLGGRPQMAPGAAANNLVELESSGRGNGKTERPNDAASPSSSSQTGKVFTLSTLHPSLASRWLRGRCSVYLCVCLLLLDSTPDVRSTCGGAQGKRARIMALSISR